MVKHTLKILRCKDREIFKVCFKQEETNPKKSIFENFFCCVMVFNRNKQIAILFGFMVVILNGRITVLNKTMNNDHCVPKSLRCLIQQLYLQYFSQSVYLITRESGAHLS